MERPPLDRRKIFRFRPAARGQGALRLDRGQLLHCGERGVCRRLAGPCSAAEAIVEGIVAGVHLGRQSRPGLLGAISHLHPQNRCHFRMNSGIDRPSSNSSIIEIAQRSSAAHATCHMSCVW